MNTQSQCLALHRGQWNGLFRQYTPDLVCLSIKKSLITFEEPEPGLIRQTNSYDGSAPQSWEYQSFATGLRFFEAGSFSNGRVQLAPFSAFATEQGFLWHDRKARIVQLFDPQGQPTSFTTICEARHGPLLDPIPVQLLGAWHGTAQILTPDWPEPEVAQTQDLWTGTDHQVRRVSHLGAQVTEQQGTLTASGVHLGSDRYWVFAEGLMARSPAQLPITGSKKSFEIEIFWWLSPTQRLRLLRGYDQRGTWHRVALINEELITEGSL